MINAVNATGENEYLSCQTPQVKMSISAVKHLVCHVYSVIMVFPKQISSQMTL